MGKKYKVVYNDCSGGFCLSLEALRLAKEYADSDSPWHDMDEDRWCSEMDTCDIDSGKIPRHDPILVRVVEELGPCYSAGKYARLVVAEIDGPLYSIDEQHGQEWVDTPSDVCWNWINIEEATMQEYNGSDVDEVADKLLAEIDELEAEISKMKKQFAIVAEDAKADVLEDIANNIGENMSVLAFGLKDLAREHREKADALAEGLPRVKIDGVLV